MGMYFRRSDAPAERAADPAVRRANLRRIGPLFAAYKGRLPAVLTLIVVSAALGVIPAFLLKNVLEAIQSNDTRELSRNAAGMIVIAIVTGALGVFQTLLSNQVGQRVMHDLRAAVFRHLQRLSLAFFTRTRTGEVQSRISNDIGGVQSVVTNTATSIASNMTTVVATMVGMLVLNLKLALFAFALIPIFVLLTRRVGNERRRIAKTTQETLADISSLVQESLSVSGIMLGKTMGRGDELADRFEADSLRLAALEVRQRMAGRWGMAAIQTSFAVMPAAVYWFGGGAAPPRGRGAGSRSRTGRRRSRSRCSSPSRPCRRGSSSPSARCSGSGSTCRPRSRSSTGSSNTSTSRSISRSSRAHCRPRPPATSSSTRSGSATTRTGRCRTSRSPCRTARRRRWWGRPAPARRRSATWLRVCTT